MRKSSAIKMISTNIKNLGYNDTQLVQDYILNVKGNNFLELDIIAFCEENICNINNSCISVKWVLSETEKNFYKENIKYINTPIMFLADKNSIEVIKFKKVEVQSVIKLKYNQLNKYFQDNRIDLEFSNIIIDKLYYKFCIKNYSALCKNDECFNDSWNCTGEVKSIDMDKEVFIAEFVEFKDEKIIKITNNVPCWILRVGACFNADISEKFINEKAIEILNPRALEYTYMDNIALNIYNEENMYAYGGDSDV